MAQVWKLDEWEAESGEMAAAWVPTTIEDDAFDVEAFLRQSQENVGDTIGAVLLRSGGTTRERWMLVGSGSVRINGTPLAAGIRVLRDRDEIRLNGGPPVYFSTERLARVEPFPGAERQVFCPRCKLPIETGAPAVLCPGCSTWFHQTTDLPCFTYAETCPLCDHQTTLDGEYRWTPEEL